MARERKDMHPAEALLARWAQESQGGSAMLPDWDADFSASFPNLWVLLTWDKVGKFMKQPGRLSFAVDGTGWRVEFMDPTAKRACAVVAPTLMDGLKKLDAAVVHEETVWRSFSRGKRGWREEKK